MEQVNLTRPENVRAKEILAGFFERSEDLSRLLEEACRSAIDNKKEDGQTA